jgi:H+/Cl- antiporter ClcA
LGVAVAAILAGMLGALMCKLILKIMHWKKGFNRLQNIAFILLAGLFIATCAYYLNDEILGSGKELMNGVLFTNEKYSPWHTVVMRTLGTIVCFNVGAAGGVFAPSLAAGASVGSWLSGLLHLSGGNANILILSGMVGFLTGVTRTPFTSAILVLEMTDRHSVIFHLMLAALISNVAALLIDKHSFYEQLKKGYVEETIRNEGKNNQEQQPSFSPTSS